MSPLAQPVKFVLVGAGGYLVNLLAFATLFGGGVAYVEASLVAFFTSNALMYLGNRYFTFRLGHDALWRTYLRYLVVGCVIAALNATLLAALVEGANGDPRFCQALSLAALAPLAFVLNKRWTFRLRAA